MIAIPPEREDLLRDGWAPLKIRKFLRRIGGVNPYGEPNYRLARAEKIMIHLGNMWTDWPEDTPIEEQDGLCFSEERVLQEVTAKVTKSGTILKSLVEMPDGMHLSQTKPLRRVAEMRWVRRYPYHEGWMLQHWDSRVFYGDRQWWESKTVPNHPGLQMLGPYPERGRYEQTVIWTTIEGNRIQMHSALLAELPSLTKLEEAMADHNRKRAEGAKSPNADWNRLIAINERTQIEEKERQRYREYCTNIYRDKVKVLMGTSLAAGRLRSELAKKAGMTSHVGN